MPNKKPSLWSKRQSGSQNYHRTGGLVAIETTPDVASNSAETKTTRKTGSKVPSRLSIITTKNNQFLLWSPAVCLSACPKPLAIHKPLPNQPRYSCPPSTPELPVELPGSILLDNEGLPHSLIKEPIVTRPASQNIQRRTLFLDREVEDEEEFCVLLSLFPEPLPQSNSVPGLGLHYGEMRPLRSGNALNPNTGSKPIPPRLQHKKSLSDTSFRRRPTSRSASSSELHSRDSPRIFIPVAHDVDSAGGIQESVNEAALESPILKLECFSWHSNARCRCRSELGPATSPAQTTTRRKQIEEFKDTAATQDQTISILQTPIASLSESHDSHIESLTSTHLAEVASLKNHSRVPEEQLAQRPSLDQALSNDVSFFLEATEPETPTREFTQQAEEIDSSNPALDKQDWSPQRTRNSPDMENIKRRLSSTRGLDTASRNLLPELNQYKQNNVALQKQIVSLMAKLNESKQNERALRTSLDDLTQKCNEWQTKAEEASKSVKSAQALQNTIDHLESRLEIANIERLDAEEQLFNVHTQKSPFNSNAPKFQALLPGGQDHVKNAHLSTSTVFSSSISPGTESLEFATRAAFVAHIERLQNLVREKDSQMLEVESALTSLRQKHDQLEAEHNATLIQAKVQTELLKKAQRNDAHVEQLRAAVFNRDAVISEKVKSIRAIERELKHHKLLLQAQIRRYATMMLHAPVHDDPLPELSTLTTRSDVNKWIQKLQERLKKEKPMIHGKTTVDPKDALIVDLREEIDFYVREIIYYKLDIRGYKSDIKKLNMITAQLSRHGSRGTDGSDTSSVRPAATPSQACSGATTPELSLSENTSPAMTSPSPRSISATHPFPPPPSGSAFAPKPSQATIETVCNDEQSGACTTLLFPMMTQPPKDENSVDMATKTGHIVDQIASHKLVGYPTDQKKPTLRSGNRPRFGKLLTNLPLVTPAASQRHVRSISESVVTSSTKTEVIVPHSVLGFEGQTRSQFRGRSASESGRGKTTPDRRPQPRHGLFEFPKVKRPKVSGTSNLLHNNDSTKALMVSQPIERATRTSTRLLETGAPSVPVSASCIVNDAKDETMTPSCLLPTARRSRAGSAELTSTTTPLQPLSPPERKMGAASTSRIASVTTMGSPHNPTLMAPSTSMPPTSCSITRNASLQIVPRHHD
ncbi:hypothetical protein BDU57DRAFT_508874 [Ampelomyces quisqualis]|uniref:Uncharacterized protein n=1 Tax=Ampelomyces quisqualis TaxID=50730 RepID=A0A6A5QYI8_AMPQU|nr:hypothetical protein BDU57DRAFT_508874 [Ampelomyces quisqualis]